VVLVVAASQRVDDAGQQYRAAGHVLRPCLLAFGPGVVRAYGLPR
jgi:hypothetical protein